MRRSTAPTPEQLLHFAATACPGYKGALTLDTRIGEDLKQVGDDAEEFLELFATAFDVDLSELPLNEYFPGECSASMFFYLARQKAAGGHPVCRLPYKLDAWLWGSVARRPHFKTLTLQDLLECARRGKWSPKP